MLVLPNDMGKEKEQALDSTQDKQAPGASSQDAPES